MQDRSQISRNKRPKVNNRNDPLKRARLNFSDLPEEIQEIILIQAAVAIRLSSQSFEEVYETMARVCRRWRELLCEKQFYTQVQQQTFLIDSACRYLETAQSVRITGVDTSRGIRCAVTLGDKLYVTEQSELAPLPLVSMYDIDCIDVRHDNPLQRQISCTNIRPLIVNGLAARASLIIPCPHNNCLYTVQSDATNEADVIIHKLKPDGSTVLHWTVPCRWSIILAISLNASGARMTILSLDLSYSYTTATGDLVMTMNVLDENGKALKEHMATIGVETEITSLMFGLCLDTGKEKVLMAAGGDRCLLMMNSSHINLINFRLTSVRELRRATARKFKAYHHWFDLSRGLVFCAHSTKLRVLRLTH